MDPLSVSRRMTWLFGLACVLVASACDLEVRPIARIPDAENALFTQDGRLFVTGGGNAFEITHVNGRFQRRPLSPEACNFTGMATRSGVLYAACVRGPVGFGRALLMAGSLRDGAELSVIYEFRDVGLPNGIGLDAFDRLLVADSNPLDSKIVALAFAPGDPRRVVREEIFDDRGFLMANGLEVFRDKVFVTDVNALKTIEIRADGSAGRTRLLALRAGVFDDLSVSAHGVLVADFLNGQIALYTLDGELVADSSRRFVGPSSITPTQGPMFEDGAVLVTEKGILGDLESAVGNRISQVALQR